jgi:predicted deacylase
LGKDEEIRMTPETETQNSKTVTTERIQHAGADIPGGPIVVLFVGIHGNETAGVRAVENVLGKISANGASAGGSLYAITGNLEALARGVRYVDTDLNRLWEMYNTERDFSVSVNVDEKTPVEYLESLRVKSAIEEILEKHNHDRRNFIFADLHTTSSESCAFILLNDSLANREVARKFPVPQILGIEENIQGTLLSYINNLGYKAIGFEAGAHTSEKSVERSEAFIELLLHNTGVMKLDDKELRKCEEIISAYSDVPDTYFEIRYHHLIENAERFNMIAGFNNFDPVKEGIPLAYDEGAMIRAPESGRIFMPLYQKRGNDGFMIIEEVSPFWLTLSGWLRQSSIHSILRFLPGVEKKDSQTYEVNRDVAIFFVKEIFHLLGYRVTEKDRKTYVCYRR